MVGRDHNNRQHYHKTNIPKTTTSLIILLSLTSLILILSLSSRNPNKTTTTIKADQNRPCDYSDGKWVYDPTVSYSRYDHTCKEIFKGWNCVASNKSNGPDLARWRWKPTHCDLPPFDPLLFIRRYRHTNIVMSAEGDRCRQWGSMSFQFDINMMKSAGFVGDSLNRNMFVSLFCTLKKVSGEVKKWRPVGADRLYTFLQYNLTIGYHRTNLLARYGRWSANVNGGTLESLGYREGYRVDVDIPDSTWSEALSFHDVIIFNTGHWWWAPSKFDPIKSPMIFFEKGLPIIPPIAPDAGLDVVLKHTTRYVEQKMKPGATIFLRTQSPRHFEGGDWDQGGSCQRLNPLSSPEVENFFSMEKNGTNVEVTLVNQHLYKAFSRSVFNILDITSMSKYRADAHPSTEGGKRHDDCMHWCLPGVTDTWNDLFIAQLDKIRSRN